nr:hypothetical protein Iba_chr04fCG9430 [Ipomoea batatas]
MFRLMLWGLLHLMRCRTWSVVMKALLLFRQMELLVVLPSKVIGPLFLLIPVYHCCLTLIIYPMSRLGLVWPICLISRRMRWWLTGCLVVLVLTWKTQSFRLMGGKQGGMTC